jgi:hypothetical protein
VFVLPWMSGQVAWAAAADDFRGDVTDVRVVRRVE